MASFSAVEYAGGASWKFTPSGTAPFDYYLDGKLVFPQSSNTYEFINSPTGSATEPPPMEVVDANDTDLPASTDYPPFLAIQWRGVALARYYIVEQSVAAVWTQRARVVENGAGYYQHRTNRLADKTSHLWRVTAIDSEGYSSQVKAYTITIACHPQPPGIVLTYASGTGNATVSAA